jgi:phage tail-like protein
MPQSGDRKDPYAAFNFRVEINDLGTIAGFAECSGLVSQADPIEYRAGDSIDSTPIKLPGLKKFNNITLKRGFTTSHELWTWHETTLNGQTQRYAGAIVLQDEGHQDAVRWEFQEGWVTKYEGPAFNAKNNEVAINSIEIAHEGLYLKP